MSERGARTALWLVAVVAMLAYLVTSLRVTTDISEFLPSEEGSVRAELVRAVASGPLAQRMVLSVEVGAPHAAEVSRRLEAEILADDALSASLASVEGGTSAESDEALWAVYAQRWPYLYARDADEAAARLSQEGLEDRAERLLAQLQGPMSAVLSRVAPDDPFLVLPEVFERLAASQAGSVALQDGRFVAEDGRYAILFVTTHARAFENAEQAKVLAGIDEAFARTRAGFDGPMQLEMSGVNRISIAVQAAIEDDIRRISVFSILGLGLLLFFVFRGPRLVLLSAMSLSTGVLAALSVSVLLFGRVHGISLAFGASLIGLAIDYVVHLYCHHAEASEGRDRRATLRSIWPALTMAAGTSMIGFLVLGFSGFPGLREVAVFAVVGLGVSLLAVRWVVVHWLPASLPPTQFRTWLADALLRGLHGLRQRLWIAWGLLAAVVVVVMVGLPQLHWSDALVDMGSLDASLMAEEERVRARVSRFDQSRFIASVGADEEAALRSAEQVRDVLEREELAAGFASISALVPSQARQREVAALLRETPALRARFDAAFAAAGFRPEQFVGLRWALEDELPPPVRPADLAGTPLAAFSEGFLMPLGDRVVALTFLHGVSDSDALGARLEAIEGAVYVDQQTMISDFGDTQRGRTAGIVALGLLAIFAILWSRYRRVGAVFAVLAPSLLAVAFTWALLSILGEPADLVIVSASLMIVSLGVDYGVFLVDSSRQEGPQLRSALLGVAVAGTTTLIGFGLLALSTYPLLFRIGLTAAVGVPTAMMLAPISLILFRSKESE